MAKLTTEQVKQELNALGVSYSDDMNYAQLYQLLKSAKGESQTDEQETPENATPEATPTQEPVKTEPQDQDAQLRADAEKKARIEAEAKAKVEAEMKTQKETQPQRKPSPEEIAVKNDPLIEVVFTNIESPEVTHFFTYGGKKFELKDGETVKLPLCVVNHLNNLKVPVRRYDENAPSGQQTVVTGMRNRFSCQPVNLQPHQVG